MEIIIRQPQPFKGEDYWHSKMYGVILVEKESDIEPLWKMLCEQDDYWESYKHIIKVAPKEISGVGELAKMCQYAGKTDIYNVKAIKAVIPFVLYQYMHEIPY